MNEYQKIVSILQTKKITFEQGLSLSEIEEIEKFYNISFPIELKNLYSVGLPVSNGFYNWRNMSNDNVKQIKKVLQRPILDIQAELIRDYEDNNYYNDEIWCDKWGVRPNNINDACKILQAQYNQAPKLIPIYLHRYMPFISHSEETPVFSIMGSDIIYCGNNLISYLETEFKLKSYHNNMKCQHVDFWSDLL